MPPPSFYLESAPVDLGFEIGPMRKMPHTGESALGSSVVNVFGSTSSGAEIRLWATFSGVT